MIVKSNWSATINPLCSGTFEIESMRAWCGAGSGGVALGDGLTGVRAGNVSAGVRSDLHQTESCAYVLLHDAFDHMTPLMQMTDVRHTRVVQLRSLPTLNITTMA